MAENIIRKTISYLLKAVIFIAAVVGTALCAWGGGKGFMGGKTALMYFTIQSNLFMALIAAAGALFMIRGKISQRRYVFKFVGTVAITLTGFVFCFILAPTLKGGAWNIQNILTHVIVPISSIIDFFLTGKKDYLKKTDVFTALIPPAAYIIFAAAAFKMNLEFAGGANYPYFFLNWGSPLGAFGFGKELPFMGCVWWILIGALLVLGVGFLYRALLGIRDKVKK